MSLYPLKFNPILKERIWGGKKLSSVLGKNLDSKDKIGESWEISAVKDDVSIVSNGFLKGMSLSALIIMYKEKLVGAKVYNQFRNDFPLLIKFIDANDDLSVQVHPDDELSKKRHNSFGKTEMWYVMEADRGAELTSGLKREIDSDQFIRFLQTNDLSQHLATHKVVKDDVFFIPAGRVHAIGSGILLAEIQQTSDVTYRIYDYGRKDADGNERELHTELAVDAINFNDTKNVSAIKPAKDQETAVVVESSFFSVSVINVIKQVHKNYRTLDSFVIYICVEGECELTYNNNEAISVQKGDTVLIPAELDDVVLTSSSCKLLEVYL